MTFRILTLIAVFLCMPALAADNIEQKDYIYEPPTMEKLSRMYWRLSKFAEDDKTALDNFMKINECEIYTDYAHDEFEWRGIRDAAKSSIKGNKDKYPLRFEFVQPFTFDEYDFEKQGFAVAAHHQIESSRRFEVLSDDLYSTICGDRKPIAGYPKAMLLEFSRPFEFNFFPVDPDLAQQVIEEKLSGLDELDPKYKTQHHIESLRTAYLILKVKFFAYKEGDDRSQHGYFRAKLLTIIEGIEIYADKERTTLLYEESFRRKRTISKFEQSLKQKYEARKNKLRALKEKENNEATL